MEGKTRFYSRDEELIKELDGVLEPLAKNVKVQFQDTGDTYKVYDWHWSLGEEVILNVILEPTPKRAWIG